uniref:Uncharacterized protein n=1 Tax=Anguilla anguilla TaxID=7936 RepID=A0A0E9UFE4_ANGAN
MEMLLDLLNILSSLPEHLANGKSLCCSA